MSACCEVDRRVLSAPLTAAVVQVSFHLIPVRAVFEIPCGNDIQLCN